VLAGGGVALIGARARARNIHMETPTF